MRARRATCSSVMCKHDPMTAVAKALKAKRPLCSDEVSHHGLLSSYEDHEDLLLLTRFSQLSRNTDTAAAFSSPLSQEGRPAVSGTKHDVR